MFSSSFTHSFSGVDWLRLLLLSLSLSLLLNSCSLFLLFLSGHLLRWNDLLSSLSLLPFIHSFSCVDLQRLVSLSLLWKLFLAATGEVGFLFGEEDVIGENGEDAALAFGLPKMLYGTGGTDDG